MKITDITIEGLHNVEKRKYHLSDVNYFYGKNGAGKSTILQAIQLALLGYIPGTSKTNEAIFKHSNSHTMAVTLDLLDESGSSYRIRRIWTKSNGRISSSVEIDPDLDISNIVGEIELPIFNFSDFIGMSANKLKEWFINFLPDNAAAIDWKSVFSEYEEHISCMDQIFSDGPVSIKGIEGVRQMNAFLKSLLAFKKSESERIQNTIQSLICYDDVDQDYNIDEIDSRINTIMQDIKQVSAYKAAADANRRINAELESYSDLSSDFNTDDKAIALRDQMDALKLKIDSFDLIDYQSQIYELSAKLHNLKNIIQNPDVCPYTNLVCGSIQSMKSESKLEYDAVLHQLNQIKQKSESQDCAIKNLKDSYDQCIRDLNDLLNRYDRRNKLKSMLVPTCEPLNNVDIDSLHRELTELQTIKSKLLANQRYAELIDSITKDKFVTDQDIQYINKLVKLTDANNMQTTMMEAPFINLAHDMNRYIQQIFDKSVSVKFNLASKANSFSFGIDRSGVYIPFDLLSSGEKCLFMLSMMLCIVSISNSDLKLILIDDMLDHLDSNKADQLFKSISNISDVQIILAGVVSHEFAKDNCVAKEIK